MDGKKNILSERVNTPACQNFVIRTQTNLLQKFSY